MQTTWCVVVQDTFLLIDPCIIEFCAFELCVKVVAGEISVKFCDQAWGLLIDTSL